MLVTATPIRPGPAADDVLEREQQADVQRLVRGVRERPLDDADRQAARVVVARDQRAPLALHELERQLVPGVFVPGVREPGVIRPRADGQVPRPGPERVRTDGREDMGRRRLPRSPGGDRERARRQALEGVPPGFQVPSREVAPMGPADRPRAEPAERDAAPRSIVDQGRRVLQTRPDRPLDGQPQRPAPGMLGQGRGGRHRAGGGRGLGAHPRSEPAVNPLMM